MLDRAQRFAGLMFDAAAETDEHAFIGDHLWTAFRRSGLAMSPFPRDLGGDDLCRPERSGELCTVLRLLGSADLSIARLFEGHVNAVSLVTRYGERDQLRALAARIAAGGLSAVWGANDARGLHVAGEGGGTLQGRKVLSSGAGFVTDPLVTATAPEGQVLCLLRLTMDEPIDLSGWQAQGMRSTATGAIDFSGTVVTSENMIGEPGDFMRQPFFSGGAWRFCAAHCGATERLVDLFKTHLLTTKRGEDPYQLQRLAQAMAAAKTARYFVEDAARRLASDEMPGDQVVGFANLTRMVTERCALDVMETVQRGVGLTSFVRPHPIERVSRDLATYLRQPVPDLAMSDAARAFLGSSHPVGDF
ncbi:acyl-CoA dehydrogenase family protein [Bradyrhizobium sp. HKCCYLS3077]|uniref:acyl-CoA dehydrogenase family protein n=1 Tax=Bradyrhizobium sp. HKCCYLS3077 TaxID=3420761 RepID=UPI003EBA89C6